MRRSSYQDRMEINRAIATEAMNDSRERYCIDIATIALHRLGWGYDRICRFLKVFGEAYEYYGPALQCTEESDVFQEHMDNEIKDIVKGREDAFIPFTERYEWVTKDKYKPRHNYSHKKKR